VNKTRDTLSQIPIASELDIKAMAALMHGRHYCALVGAGVSTASGIPDYRGPTAPKPRPEPMRFASFRDSEKARKRYWARALLGFQTIKNAKANDAHKALSALEKSKALLGLITQNVDGLHQKAASKRVVELHGSLHRVRCLSCDDVIERDEMDARLRAANPKHLSPEIAIAPDGDAHIAQSLEESFMVVDCERCGGILKPDVVYFGENVRKPVLQNAYDLFDESEGLLIVGSSLEVYSGRRFLHRAKKQNKPVIIAGFGRVRESEKADLVVSGLLEDALSRLVLVV